MNIILELIVRPGGFNHMMQWRIWILKGQMVWLSPTWGLKLWMKRSSFSCSCLASSEAETLAFDSASCGLNKRVSVSSSFFKHFEMVLMLQKSSETGAHTDTRTAHKHTQMGWCVNGAPRRKQRNTSNQLAAAAMMAEVSKLHTCSDFINICQENTCTQICLHMWGLQHGAPRFTPKLPGV